MGNSNDLKPPQCGCARPKPCGCNPPRPVSKCDLDRTKNIWVEHGPNPGDENTPGICLLDTMQEWQVIYVLEHDPRAAKDLLRVTSDPDLIYLAQQVTLLPTAELVDMEQSTQNREGQKESYPFYGVFAGKPPLPQPKRTGNADDDD
jgi:hypothetical protein